MTVDWSLPPSPSPHVYPLDFGEALHMPPPALLHLESAAAEASCDHKTCQQVMRKLLAST
ncbi:BAG domain-containing protein [Psidium guajava]|nr:BAG domain-containing protein [Psidium guajava]